MAKALLPVILAATLGTRAQQIDLDGYQLSPERLGLLPAFSHDVHGHVRCEDANVTNAKIEFFEIAHDKASLVSTIPSIHTESDEHVSFHVCLPRGEWMFVVRANCTQPKGKPSGSLMRATHAIRISQAGPRTVGREVVVYMPKGKVDVMRAGDIEMTLAMRADTDANGKTSY